MGKIGKHSDFGKGSKGNIFRNIDNTPLQERFKIENDGHLSYRVDINGIGPRNIGGHLTADDLGETK